MKMVPINYCIAYIFRYSQSWLYASKQLTWFIWFLISFAWSNGLCKIYSWNRQSGYCSAFERQNHSKHFCPGIYGWHQLQDRWAREPWHFSDSKRCTTKFRHPEEYPQTVYEKTYPTVHGSHRWKIIDSSWCQTERGNRDCKRLKKSMCHGEDMVMKIPFFRRWGLVFSKNMGPLGRELPWKSWCQSRTSRSFPTQPW